MHEATKIAGQGFAPLFEMLTQEADLEKLHPVQHKGMQWVGVGQQNYLQCGEPTLWSRLLFVLETLEAKLHGQWVLQLGRPIEVALKCFCVRA